MTRPKGKLIALIAIFAAIGLVTASGAFTSVSAQRSVDINTAGDSSALLQLNPTTGANANDYVDTGGGTISVDLSQASGGGSGPNIEATTDVNNLFTITNQGTQSVDVQVYLNPGDTNDGSVDNSTLNSVFDITVDSLSASDGSTKPGVSTGDAIDGTDSSNPTTVTLDPGESVTVGFKIDLTGSTIGTGTQLLNDIKIVAN